VSLHEVEESLASFTVNKSVSKLHVNYVCSMETEIFLVTRTGFSDWRQEAYNRVY